jgi:hypothetical protein
LKTELLYRRPRWVWVAGFLGVRNVETGA